MFLCSVLQDIKKLLQCRAQVKGRTTLMKHELFQALSRPGIPEPPVQPRTVDSCCVHGFSGGKVETGTHCVSAWRPSIPACPGGAVLQLNSDTPPQPRASPLTSCQLGQMTYPHHCLRCEMSVTRSSQNALLRAPWTGCLWPHKIHVEPNPRGDGVWRRGLWSLHDGMSAPPAG